MIHAQRLLSVLICAVSLADPSPNLLSRAADAPPQHVRVYSHCLNPLGSDQPSQIRSLPETIFVV